MWAQRLEDCKDPADYAYCTCKVYSCGYSQPKRKNISIERLTAGTAETDCSAGVSWWLFMGGYLDECPWFHTGIERKYLAEHGFEVIDANAGFVKMQRNDVLLRERNDALGVTGHTALYIGDGLQAEALRTERHDAGYDGSDPGDNDGGETVVRPLTYDWQWVLRKRGTSVSGSKGDDMTFLFTCDGVHAGHVYLYDALMVRRVDTYEQQEVVKEAYRRCRGEEIPMFYLSGGDHLIALVNSGPVS